MVNLSLTGRIFLFFIVIFSVESIPLNAQQNPFNKGVNLTGWFQVPDVRQIQFTRYTKKDFEQIKSLGCDVIRLPVNLHFMTSGEPEYTIEPLFYDFLDEVVDWAEDLDMHLIIDNHTFDPSQDTDPGIGPVLEKVWLQLADHYKDRSGLIYYEILNEPHGISDQDWNTIQQKVVNTIRTVDNKHTIIIGPANWNSFHNLANMPEYAENNLIYTFHFYDPFIFTHQGASWVDPSMVPLSGVPFPYDANRMPEMPNSLTGSWIESSFNNYHNEGTVERLKELIDIAVQFQQTRNVPIFCGEFGVLMDNSPEEDRIFWHETVRNYFEENNIAWTIWDYHWGFGIFEKDSNGLFDHDLNVPLLEALGMTAPPQTDFMLYPDSIGFKMYTDFVGEDIYGTGGGGGIINFYSTAQPNNEDHCLYWSGSDRYNSIKFDFVPDKDLSVLQVNDYALDLFIRGDNPGTKLDIRFVNRNTSDPDSYPWRMGYTIDDQTLEWNNRWQHLHIPLSAFMEKGAWDPDEGWLDPRGEFDWSAIDLFEIVAEHHDLIGHRVWVDNLIITDMDTAQINDPTELIVTIENEQLSKENEFRLFPNPAGNTLTIESTASRERRYSIMNLSGQMIMNSVFRKKKEVDLSGIQSGLYIIKIFKGPKIEKIEKFIIN